jgi:hypothetical protein
VLVIAPPMDKDAALGDVRQCVGEVERIFRLYGVPKRLQLPFSEDYSRFSIEIRATADQWLRVRVAESH